MLCLDIPASIIAGLVARIEDDAAGFLCVSFEHSLAGRRVYALFAISSNGSVSGIGFAPGWTDQRLVDAVVGEVKSPKNLVFQ
jgi:hypothetical protein